MTRAQLRVAVVGCGLIGHKRAQALGDDLLIGCYDRSAKAADEFAREYQCQRCETLESILELKPDVVIVAVIHADLAAIACAALEAGAHVLVEKPAGVGTSDVQSIAEVARRAQRLVKVGFNHRFHPGIERAVTEARSGDFGELLFARGRYGHGGRPGYDAEWRADPALSGGGEIVDQGMHLLDLYYWLFGELPVHSALFRTQFWHAPVDDNAVVILGEHGGVGDRTPWAMLHVSWTEWKNLFSLEIYCRSAKFAIDGLARSYGPQRLRIYRMRPELGPPDVEEIHYPEQDESWAREWAHFSGAVSTLDGRELLGDLGSAFYAWDCVEKARSL